MADEKQPSALLRRHDQLKRWEESDTNRASDSLSSHNRKVKFQDGCVFLAACSSGDCEEVLRMLEKNADINTANIDGLTALHQACIDDNLDMVEFLVEHSADVDVCDNEGWTPLHATASCGFTEIARYLLRIGANVAAVNNDGDLPFDICEDGEMEALLQEEMDRQGVDADAARSEEENQMLADANKWLSNKSVKEKRHPKTGATALHVACAKGYMKVISVLMQAGSDINAKDCDGWTPLHAAAHWGQEEACKVLAEHMCDMETKNNAGQSAFDVADSEIIKLLEELKTKQATLKDTADVQNEIIQHRGQHQKRRPVTTTITNLDQPDNDPRSSVTRMSGDQKQSVTLKTKERGDPNLIHQTTPESVVEKDPTGKTGSSSEGEGEESSESETGKNTTEKQNAINNQTSGVKQVHDIPSTTTVEIQKPEMPKIDEKGELGQISNDLDTQNEADKVEISIKDQVPRIERIGDGDNQLTDKTGNKVSFPPSSISETPDSRSTDRSYEPPRRDEEAETLRKARAKRARETRRSTQGVTLEDIQQAEKALKDPSKVTSTTTGTTTTTTSSTSGADDKSRVPEAGSQKDSERVPGLESTKKEVSASEDTTVLRRRTLEERRQDDLRSSYRKSRDSVKDYSTDSAYIPRRERNTLSTSDGSSTTSSLNAGSGLTRVSSLRTNRIRNGELESRNEDKDKEERQKDSKDDSQEKSHDMRTVRARRTRKERRSTGIVSYDAKNDKMLTFPIDFCFKDEDEKEEEKEEKKEDKKETEDKSSYRHRGQYSSTSDVGDKYSSRSSYADHYQSTPSLDSNYKKLYEDEKYTTERLRKELERTKKELIEAKAELDRLVKRTEANKAADSNDKREKRALERKLSEMEEELKKMDQLRDDNKRLKEENGALIRVISKLSK
ncbi:protein phosphatase 1 regulatory subunit 12A-like isoform X17 [Mizuhopecten yessoensis]|uniref:protein phosphatase 1 regulatory subunit 12A-like isoform X17 n=1 Tax=Mizuhopecten yessoensis TaxID=6573 RepID=UPI000B45B12E|nr:protein phosphatase 1 regulatory subunit 12A-like isoform X17 [Mizuhopecten yessoensis]